MANTTDDEVDTIVVVASKKTNEAQASQSMSAGMTTRSASAGKKPHSGTPQPSPLVDKSTRPTNGRISSTSLNVPAGVAKRKLCKYWNIGIAELDRTFIKVSADFYVKLGKLVPGSGCDFATFTHALGTARDARLRTDQPSSPVANWLSIDVTRAYIELKGSPGQSKKRRAGDDEEYPPTPAPALRGAPSELQSLLDILPRQTTSSTKQAGVPNTLVHIDDSDSDSDVSDTSNRPPSSAHTAVPQAPKINDSQVRSPLNSAAVSGLGSQLAEPSAPTSNGPTVEPFSNQTVESLIQLFSIARPSHDVITTLDNPRRRCLPEPEFFNVIIYTFQVKSSWSFAMIIPACKEVKIDDSVPLTNTQKILDLLYPNDVKEWRFTKVKISQPDNQADCGVSCVARALYAMAGLNLTTNVDVEFWRSALTHGLQHGDHATLDAGTSAAQDPDPDPVMLELPTPVNIFNIHDTLKDTLLAARAARAGMLEASRAKQDSCATMQRVLDVLCSEDAIAELETTYRKQVDGLQNDSVKVALMIEQLKTMSTRMVDAEKGLQAGSQDMAHARRMAQGRLYGLNEMRACAAGMRKYMEEVRTKETERRETLTKVVVGLDVFLAQLGCH